MSRMAKVRVAWCAAAAVATGNAGCDRDVTAGGEVGVVIDTVGGVLRVTNPAPAEILELEPVLSLGAVGGLGEPRPDEFASIRSVIADAEGRIYVADVQTNELKVFDRNGDFLRMLGRAGEGPGEFGQVYGLGWLGDTLAVLDPATRASSS